MIGSLIIGITTGMVAAVAALFAGFGLLAALGIYALSGTIAMLMAVFVMLYRAAGGSTEDWADDAMPISTKAQGGAA